MTGGVPKRKRPRSLGGVCVSLLTALRRFNLLLLLAGAFFAAFFAAFLSCVLHRIDSP